MSIAIEYLFNADADTGELAKAINSVLGTSLAPIEDDTNTFACELFGMELVFRADHGYVNDRDADFESYRFVIGNKTWGSDSLRSIQLETMFMVAFVLHQRLGIAQGMLVYEVQRVLGRYEEREGEWLESTSGTPVTMPEHLLELHARLDSE